MAAGPRDIAVAGHLLPGHKFTWGLPTVRLAEPQAGSCTPNPPHPREQGEERQPGLPALWPSRLPRSKLMAGDLWSRVPEEGSQLWERRRRPSRGCSVHCKMSHVPPQRHRPGEAIPQGPGLGGCFRRRSDSPGNVCAALWPRGKGPSWKRRRGTAQEVDPLC